MSISHLGLLTTAHVDDDGRAMKLIVLRKGWERAGVWKRLGSVRLWCHTSVTASTGHWCAACWGTVSKTPSTSQEVDPGYISLDLNLNVVDWSLIQAWACSVGLQTEGEDVEATINELTRELEVNKSSLDEVSFENQMIHHQLDWVRNRIVLWISGTRALVSLP